MDIGTRLKQARLEAGLSQRQLCGDTITRNMLSQIENGSARPSMDTLRVLAGRLGKPMGYFLEEQAVISPNQALMEQARQASPAQALEILKNYRSPDPVFDRERWLLEALSCLELAAQVCDAQPGYARTLLEQAEAAGEKTPYYTTEHDRRRLLLSHRAQAAPAAQLEPALPALTQELLLRARAALERGEPERCAAFLEAADTRDARWHWLRAEGYFQQKQYAKAAEHYRRSEQTGQVYARLEICCRETEDFKMAYYYACKQREEGSE